MRKYGGSRELLMEPVEMKTLLAGSDPDGGYTLTPAMGNRIITKLYETDPMRQLAACLFPCKTFLLFLRRR